MAYADLFLWPTLQNQCVAESLGGTIVGLRVQCGLRLWVAALIRPPPAGSDHNVDGIDEVFQVNHCHMGIPGAGENIFTKLGERIWLQNIQLLENRGFMQPQTSTIWTINTLIGGFLVRTNS